MARHRSSGVNTSCVPRETSKPRRPSEASKRVRAHHASQCSMRRTAVHDQGAVGGFALTQRKPFERTHQPLFDAVQRQFAERAHGRVYIAAQNRAPD